MSEKNHNDEYIMIKRICLSLIGLSIVTGTILLIINSKYISKYINSPLFTKKHIPLGNNTSSLILSIIIEIIVFIVVIIRMDSDERSEKMGMYIAIFIGSILFSCLINS